MSTSVDGQQTLSQQTAQEALNAHLTGQANQLSGNFRLFITDAPAPLKNLFVTFSAVEAQSQDGSWHFLGSDLSGKEFDLLAYPHPNVLPLAGANLAASSYSQLRFTFGSLRGTAFNGTNVAIGLPVGKEQLSFSLSNSLSPSLSIASGNVDPFVVAIELDAQKSLTENGDGYTFTPTGSVQMIASLSNGLLTNIPLASGSQAGLSTGFSLRYARTLYV